MTYVTQVALPINANELLSDELSNEIVAVMLAVCLEEAIK